MDHPDYITKHQKGKHLVYEDYVRIKVRLKDGWKVNRIAKEELNCIAPLTPCEISSTKA